MSQLAFVETLAPGGDPAAVMSKLLARLDIASSVRPHSRVVLKPNFTYPFYREGVTTSPGVLRALVAALRDYTADITIVESDGGSQAWRAEQAFEGHSVRGICAEFGIRAVNLSDQERAEVSAQVAGQTVQVQLPRLLLEENDFFITVPVPKVHVMTRVSLGFKNQWGCLPDVKRLRYHSDFCRKVLAINKLVRTRLAVFDGTYFLDRRGPMDGDPVRRDLLIAGEVGTATRVCCELMRVDPMMVNHLRLAIQEGMMPATLSPEQADELAPLARTFCLKRNVYDWISLAVFHSSLATRVMYDSRLAAPFHKLLYAVRGAPKDFKPIW